MDRSGVEFRPFNHEEAGPAQFAAWTACAAVIRGESWPQDPAPTIEETVRNAQAMPAFVTMERWAAWTSDETIVATANASFARTQDNPHISNFHISVVPGMRRKGLAAGLLEQVAGFVRASGRTLLLFTTDDSIPAGDAFAARIGARRGLTLKVSQLDLREVDQERIRGWLESAPGDEYALDAWDGPFAEESMDEVIRMLSIMNTAPRQELEMEDEVITPELVRDRDASMIQRHHERWNLAARHRATGEIAGYTQMFWKPERPRILEQGDTGTHPEHRGRGLARWLKAAMIERVLKERPEARFVRTDNADTNASMLRINIEMGFRPFKTWTEWQVDLPQVEAYLAGPRLTYHRFM